MNETRIFKNRDFGNLRVVKIGENPWFVLKDACRAMRNSGYMRIAKKIKENEIIYTKVVSQKGLQNTICVSEAVVFRLIRREKTLCAKVFKQWLKTQVLPSLHESEEDDCWDFLRCDIPEKPAIAGKITVKETTYYYA